MRPAEGGASGRAGHPDRIAEGSNSTPILAYDADAGKQGPAALGRCVCGAPIGSNVRGIGCRTCGAWARWRSAFRVAVHARGDA